MKIHNVTKINTYDNLKSCKKYDSKEQQLSKEPDNSHLLCKCSFGKAQVNIQKPKGIDIIKSLIGDERRIERYYTRNGVLYVRIGEPLEGFNDVLKTVAHAACHYDENNNPERIYIREDDTLETKVYDGQGKLEKQYLSSEINAFNYYKYHPDALHQLLRDNKEVYKGKYAKEMHDCINKMDEIFAQHNTYKTEEPITLYRAMHTDISHMGKIGEIFEDPSFVSTTKDLDVAKRFRHNKPIMEIKVPKNVEYLDMDGLFNIDRERWNEDELLLNRNSKFKITGYDKENDIIKAEYIL